MKLLIRIRGGESGICDYLVNGRKEGRPYSRDELDERVILDGDLSLTDTIIKTMNGDSEKYLHITLSFKEDQISTSTLKAIVEEFKGFAMEAYRTDEFNFYAEAHLPRIKSYTDALTGEHVIRKPHIHIVIPKANLLGQQHLNPFGIVEQNERFIDAFQEHINNKFGLASPKDHPRYKFNGQSEMISRYKGDLFKTHRVELRKAFLDEVISSQIESWDEFKTLLDTRGNVREVNGKRGNYLHFLPAQGKGINLTDKVFSREFIELSTAEKIKLLAPNIERSYVVESEARRDPGHISKSLSEWQRMRARELKYINSGNKKLYHTYKAADEPGKLKILAERENRFYTKYGDIHEPDRKSYPAKNQRQPPPFRRNRLHTLSELDVVSYSGRSEMLLQNHVPGELEYIRAERDHAMRWDRNGGKGDNLVVQAKRDHDKSKQKSSSKWGRIKREVDARQLLDSLVLSHGLIVDKYTITKGTDGGDRILCGKHHLNVSDFLTREMNIPWSEAGTILEKLYNSQQKHEQSQRNTWPLYLAYRSEQQPLIAKLRETIALERIQLRDAQKHERAQIREQHKSQRNRLSNGPEWRGKSGELKIAKMLLAKQQADEKAILNERHRAAQAMLSFPKVKSYAEWIDENLSASKEYEITSTQLQVPEREIVNGGLVELETSPPRPTSQKMESDAPAIIGYGSIAPIRSDIRNYKAYANLEAGIVSFIGRSGKVAFTDKGHQIDVNASRDPEAVLAALQLATQKFGSGISINGDSEFQKLCIRLAAQYGFRFKNDALNNAVASERERQMMESAKPANTDNGRYDGKIIAVTDADIYMRIPKAGAVRIPRQKLADVYHVDVEKRCIVIFRNGSGTIQIPNHEKNRGGRS